MSTKMTKQKFPSNQILGKNEKKSVSSRKLGIPSLAPKGVNLSVKTDMRSTGRPTGSNFRVTRNKFSTLTSQGPNTGPVPSNIGTRLSEIIDTGLSIGKTVSGLASGDPSSLLSIPNTLLKVVDTAKNVVRDINSSDATAKPVVLPGSNLKESGNQIVLEKLKDIQPVMTVTQLPTSNGIEVSLPPLRTEMSKVADSQGFYPETVYGSFASGPVNSPGTIGAGGWVQNDRVLPADINRFGTRVANHYARIYQQYRLKRLTVQWIPRVGYNYKGNIAMNFMLGIDPDSVTLPIGYQQISERSIKEIKSVNLPFSLTFRGDNNWKFTGVPLVSTPDSLRSFVECVFGIYTWGNESAGETLGYPVYDFELEFRGNTESPWTMSNKVSSHIGDTYIRSSPVTEYRSYLKGLWYLFRLFKKKTEKDQDSMMNLWIDQGLLHRLLDEPEYIDFVRNYMKNPSRLPCGIAYDMMFEVLENHEFLDEREAHCYDAYNFAEDFELQEMVISRLNSAASYLFSLVIPTAIDVVLSNQITYDFRKLDPGVIGKSSIDLAVRIVIANIENLFLRNYFGDLIIMGKDKIKQIEIRSGYLNDPFKKILNMNQRDILEGIEVTYQKHISHTSGIDEDYFDLVDYDNC